MVCTPGLHGQREMGHGGAGRERARSAPSAVYSGFKVVRPPNADRSRRFLRLRILRCRSCFRAQGRHLRISTRVVENAGVSEREANEILKKVHDTNPNIGGVFHRNVQDVLRHNNRTLVSPNGRTKQFLNKWEDELFREAYAQIPQSTVSDQCKRAAKGLKRRFPQAMIVMDSHDGFLTHIPIGTIDKAISIIISAPKECASFLDILTGSTEESEAPERH